MLLPVMLVQSILMVLPVNSKYVSCVVGCTVHAAKQTSPVPKPRRGLGHSAEVAAV